MLSARSSVGHRKGVAAIIGGIILFTIIFGTVSIYFQTIQRSDQLTRTAAMDRATMDLQQRLESFTITPTKLGDGDLGVKVENNGPIGTKIVRVLVFASDGSLIPNAIATPFVVNSGGSVPSLDTNIQIQGSQTYVVKAVSERGNLVAQTYPIPPAAAAIMAQAAVLATMAQALGDILIDVTTFKWNHTSGDGQSGVSVGGYPGFALPSGQRLIFSVVAKNNNPLGLGLTLSSSSFLALTDFGDSGKSWFICDGMKSPPASGKVQPYNTTKPKVQIPFNQTKVLYFGSASQNSDGAQHTPSPSMNAGIIVLYGHYDDGRPYAQTIPFEASYVTPASASASPGSGATGATITLSGSSFQGNTPFTVKWMNPQTGSTVLLTSSTTTPSGTIPSGTSFTVPSASPGYYILIVRDEWLNAAFVTFLHT